jgi:glycosyltransferase involved in cell wall biosynthesis
MITPLYSGHRSGTLSGALALLSFIIPAYNEARYLGATLIALDDAMTGIDIAHEVIVVDDASTDTTAEIATAHGATVLRVEHRHIAATRNAGARHAHGDILIFVDADTSIDSIVLRAALDALAGGAVGGGATVRLAGDPAWHERWAAAGFGWVLRQWKIAPGCFLFCTRTAFDAVQGFDETYYAAEDIAISRKLGGIGRFVALRETIASSDRKLRSFPLWDHFGLLLRITLFGRKVLHSRKDLKLWYEDRRKDS